MLDALYDWLMKSHLGGVILSVFCALAVLFFLLLIPVSCNLWWTFQKNVVNCNRIGKITREPVQFRYSQTLVEFDDNKEIFPQARILCEPGGTTGKSKRQMKKLNKILKDAFELEHFEGELVPGNARIVSIAANRFKHGTAGHEFLRPQSQGHYEYQMFGNNRLQVTVFNDGTRVWIAGFCIYISHPMAWYDNWQEHVIERCTSEAWAHGVVLPPHLRRRPTPIIETRMVDETTPLVSNHRTVSRTPSPRALEPSAPPLPVTAPEVVAPSAPPKSTAPEEPRQENLTVRFCSRLQRNAMSYRKPDGTVVHEEFNHMIGRLSRLNCIECSMESRGTGEVMEEEEAPPSYESLWK